MKFSFIIIFYFYLLNLNAQIYSITKNIDFEVYRIEQKDTLLKSSVLLHCLGSKWLSPKGILIEDSWSIMWSYQDEKGVYSEWTGVKETSSTIFLHPIRLKEFSILEFCPFPIIYFPLKVGNRWIWALENIPTIYSNSIKRGTKRAEKIVNTYVVENKILWYNSFMKQNIECFVIRGVGRSVLGETRLTAYFSEKYGFVRMNFETLNNDIYSFVLKHYYEKSEWGV